MIDQEVSHIKKSTLWTTLVLTLFLLGAWEVYCRAQGYEANPNDDKHLWAYHRDRLDNYKNDDVVIVGSSRVMFNFQLEEWKEVHGKKPLMLAAAGSSVIPVLRDVVKNSSFNGTLVVGITPPLFYVPTSMEVIPFARIQKWVNHYHDRTYADRFNHLIAKNGPQQAFSFLTTSNEIFYNELDLRTLIDRIPLSPRIPGPPPFPILYQVDRERNVHLMPQVTQDSAYADEITNFWSAVFQPPPGAVPDPDQVEKNRTAIINETAVLLRNFKQRGGRVILVRCPSQARVRDIEHRFYPRVQYWDALVEAVGAPAYHFEDHDFMNQYELPEWSHLKTEDAKKFTRDFIIQTQSDQALK